MNPSLMNGNLLAVLVAAVATFALGALWYSPVLFAKAWTEGHGFTPERLAEMQKGAAKAYASTFVCWLVMAWALEVLRYRAGVVSIGGTLRLAAFCWFGFAATVGFSQHVFSSRKITVFFIDAAYQLVSLLAMAAILALWP